MYTYACTCLFYVCKAQLKLKFVLEPKKIVDKMAGMYVDKKNSVKMPLMAPTLGGGLVYILGGYIL